MIAPPRRIARHSRHSDQRQRDQRYRQAAPRRGKLQLLNFFGDDAGLHRPLLHEDTATQRLLHRRLGHSDRRRLHDDLYRHNQLIAPPRQGRDVVVRSWALIECPAQYRNALRQVVLVHEGVRPDVLQQFVLGDHAARVAHQVQQHIEGAAVQPNLRIVAPQCAVLRVDAKLTELEYLLSSHTEGLLRRDPI